MAINKKIAELKRTLAALEARKVKLMELACKQSVNSEPRSYKDYRAAGANVNNFRSLRSSCRDFFRTAFPESTWC